MSSVWQVLRRLLADDPASPRVTFYERTPGPTHGERIELSGKVLVNWVSKAANLLVEEFDVQPGDVVTIALPAAHWRTVYWLLAAWSAGAEVTFVDSDDAGLDGDALADAGVLITNLEATGGDERVQVTLAALARAGQVSVPGAMDEAKELATFADSFSPFAAPSANQRALTGSLDFATLTSAPADVPAARRYLAQPAPEGIIHSLVAGGGVILVRGDIDDAALDALLAQEGVSR